MIRDEIGVLRGISIICYLRACSDKGKVMKKKIENIKVTMGMILS
jgi:hypothetical protein